MTDATPSGAEPDGSLLVLGVGNPDRHDDGVGPEVTRRLRGRLPPPARTAECLGDGTRLLDLWENERRVLVIDAVRSGAPPGTVHRIDPSGPHRFPAPPPTSTHGLSVAEAVLLGRTLGRFPATLIVYGVEGIDFTPGRGLSEPVSQAVERVVAAILSEVGPRRPYDTPRAEAEARRA